VVSIPLKNINQLGLFFSIYGKIKNVPNHQPDYNDTKNNNTIPPILGHIGTLLHRLSAASPS